MKLIQLQDTFYVIEENPMHGDIIILKNNNPHSEAHTFSEYSEEDDKPNSLFDWKKKLIAATKNILGCERLDLVQVKKEVILFETGILVENINGDLWKVFEALTKRFTLEEALNMWEMGSSWGATSLLEARTEQRNYLKAISVKEWNCKLVDGHVHITEKKTEVCEGDEVLIVAGDRDTVGLKYFVTNIKKDGSCVMAGNPEGINCETFNANIAEIDVYPDGESTDTSRFDYVLLKNKKQ